jgi:hypothetical protein
MDILRLDNASLHYGEQPYSSTASTCACAAASAWGCSAATAPARARCCASSPASIAWIAASAGCAGHAHHAPGTGAARDSDLRVYDFVAGGLAEAGALLARYHALLEAGAART